MTSAAVESSWTTSYFSYQTFSSPCSPMASSSSASSNSPTPPCDTSGVVSQLMTSIMRKGQALDTKKPPVSYIYLISMAIEDSEEKMLSLSGIYDWITKHFSYYQKDKAKWQNSVRHCLSFNDCFVAVKRNNANPGKGNLWRLHDECKGMLNPNNFMRRDKRFRVEGKIKKRAGKRKSPPVLDEEVVQAAEDHVKKILNTAEENFLKPNEEKKEVEVKKDEEEKEDEEEQAVIALKELKRSVAARPRIPLPSISIAPRLPTYEVSPSTHFTLPQYLHTYQPTPTYTFVQPNTEKTFSSDLYNGSLFQPVHYNYSGSWNDINKL